MDISQIETLTQENESLCLEFKTSTSQLRAAFQTICAYLNGKGGRVLIGIKNNGQAIGQDVSDATRQEIAREIKKLQPAAEIQVSYLKLRNRKKIIVLETSSGQHAPYIYDGRAYERIESSTGLMSQHRYEQLLVRRNQLNHVWEEQPAEDYDIDSLDHDEIRRTIKEGINGNRIGAEVANYSIEDILEKLKLKKNGKVINAAAVLYAKEVRTKFSNCMIRMARFRGKDKLGDFIDNQRVYGNAFRLIAAAHDFANRHLPIASFFRPDHMQRIDQPAVPALALREALINAISHRDYTNRSVSLALAIFDDRLEVWNNGELNPELKIDDLRKQHQSFPRNEIIATVFYNRDWVEGWGTGTTRMIGYCKQNDTPEPIFEEYSSGFAVIFPFKEEMRTSRQMLPEVAFENILTDRQQEILEILETKGRLVIVEVSAYLSAEIARRTISEELDRLKQLGLVSLEGRGRNAKWMKIKK